MYSIAGIVRAAKKIAVHSRHQNDRGEDKPLQLTPIVLSPNETPPIASSLIYGYDTGGEFLGNSVGQLLASAGTQVGHIAPIAGLQV